jgi:hypothetical protein
MELSKGHAPDVGDLKRLATIDTLLAQVCFSDGKQDQGRSLMEECIDHCEAYLALRPGDLQIRSTLFSAVNWMAMTYHADFKNDRLYGRWHARAIGTLERLKSHPDIHVQGIYEVSRWQRERARSLRSAGESERAQKELEKDLDFIRSVPAEETAFPGFVLNEALTLAALGRWSGEFPPIRPEIGSQAANAAIQELERTFAELTARRIGLLPSAVNPPWLMPEDLSAEAWVDRVISSIKADAATFHLDDTRIPAMVRQLWPHCVNTLVSQRWVGKLSDAHRFADRLVALAERLRRSCPDQAAAYMLLSEAYVQKAKNAYRVDGEFPIVWERKALDAAVQATRLEPENDGARDLVKNRSARLDKLVSK